MQPLKRSTCESVLMRWVKLEPISQNEVSQKEKEKYHTLMDIYGASLVAQRVKHLPTMWETQVQFLGWEDPLEKEMTTLTPVPLPGKSHGQRSLVGYSPWGRKGSDTTERLHFHCH